MVNFPPLRGFSKYTLKNYGMVGEQGINEEREKGKKHAKHKNRQKLSKTK